MVVPNETPAKHCYFADLGMVSWHRGERRARISLDRAFPATPERLRELAGVLGYVADLMQAGSWEDGRECL